MDALYPYKILFVEDEEATRKNYATYLKMLFDDVYEAEDGEEAYKIYQEKQPDIMIIDINIPKLNGLDLLKKIRQNDHKTKALMLTAHADTKLLLESTVLKLTKYLVKPISRKELQEAIELTIKELKDFNVVSVKKIELSQSYHWDIQQRDLKHHNTSVGLTSKEKSLLTLFFSHKNRLFTYDEIFEYVWDNEEEINLNSLKNIIKRLRKKLPEDTIVNIFNEGYKINF